ncbi:MULTISPECIES: DUF6708 domain-containing protein [unclassified Pseudomonas]|uniref:DUF6708 domain-containing protein n=1 Tax=unclassified Pseudomonas TaxID=196821 RepID=UPI002AC9B4E2|nr:MULTISPECIES: DUF6708 domain-containing protein [unclassified Pseudomonas]MEB0046414.1 hypothetical protein [Pseudomonas sp. Dout3]MEB0099324.1 hypothetical protein [Pseudomonas sp. DC1.2]WPX59470.1 hypothetical protein RHM68_02115 [Pseudomonas sp. DC1.2]
MDINKSASPHATAPTVRLEAAKPTGEKPIAPFIIDEHNEDYLTLQDAGEPDRGRLAGFFGWLAIALLCLELLLMLYGIHKSVLVELGITTLLFFVLFVWEAHRPLPLPIVFNRRTREVYVDQDGVLFHAPWDGLCAEVDEFQLVDTQLASMQNATLEISVWKFQQPEMVRMISLGTPFGKTLNLQKSFWEYLRAYMNNGPWFDGQGNHSDSDAFVKRQLLMRQKISTRLMSKPTPIEQMEKEGGDENYISGRDAIKIILKPIFYPLDRIQKLVYGFAKRRSHNVWPHVITERLKPNGPITRLVDLEDEKKP